MYSIVYTKKAAADIPNLKSAKLDKKAKALIDLIRETPFQNPPPYEKLVGDLQGAYSRRINIKHRLVYEVLLNSENLKDESGTPYEGVVKIISLWTHYER
ncbi:MAG: Txe/YoeB family addiction module toxin [Oscillospiraceae bacterium]|jgi:Txe/YoeB family toxin of toxin-antitoxin system|nr:Txe/YoeB family addiction module toxin [Oscillospiraceae bacterium]